MDFVTAVKTCLTQKYARFEGRASRPEYWWFILAYVIGAVVIALLSIGLLYYIYVLALIVPVTAAGWRRLQDTGRPGWYILVPVGVGILTSLLTPRPGYMGGPMGPGGAGMGGMGLVAVLGLVQLVLVVIYIWWLSRPSEPQDNAYGPPPQA